MHDLSIHEGTTVTDNDGVTHALEAETPQGFRSRCSGCSYLWPCPAVRILPEQLIDGGEMVADLVDVGWSIFRRPPAGSDAPTVGGPVVAVDRPADPTLPPRSFRVLDFVAGRPYFRTFRPGEFDPLLSDPPNSATLRTYARRLCAEFAKGKGTVTPEDLDLVRTAYHLLQAVV